MGGKQPRAFVVLAIVVLGLVGQPASAETFDFHVRAGAVHPTNPQAPYEYTRFYPEHLQVHRNQTVRWTLAGNPDVGGPFHTITFSDAGRPAAFRADEIPGQYATTDAWAFGSNCGRNGLAPCVLNEGTSFISSGIPPFGNSPFEVTIDMPVGSYTYLCTVHPGMEATVEVVDDAQTLATQEQIDTQVAADVQADSSAADALFADDQVPVSAVEDGQTVWRVLLGDSTEDGHVSIVAYLPTAITAAAGDKLRFVYRDRIVNEIHTTTFPSDAVSTAGPFGFAYPSCDPDDAAGGAVGVPGPWGIAGPPCPGTLELIMSPWTTRTTALPGNQVLLPAQYTDSGILVPPGGMDVFGTLPPDRQVPQSFEAEFPLAGAFTYACFVHGIGMSGSVSVT